VLQLAIGHDPVRYREIIANPTPKKVPPTPPGRRGHPPSLDPLAPGGPGVTLPPQRRASRLRWIALTRLLPVPAGSGMV
jgi:hypothetical protein